MKLLRKDKENVDAACKETNDGVILINMNKISEMKLDQQLELLRYFIHQKWRLALGRSYLLDMRFYF